MITKQDSEALLSWYDTNARDLPWRVKPAGYRETYPSVLAEIMLQQTTVATVIPYFATFTKRWPSWDKLAEASEDDVLTAWSGLGYYSRARRLHALAKSMAATALPPKTFQDWLAMPGIGPYTAGAIASLCNNQAVPAIDGNVERVLARFVALDEAFPAARQTLERMLSPRLPARAGAFNEALIELGATICRPRQPQCEACPLVGSCQGKTHPQDFPVKVAKKPPKPCWAHAFIITRNDGAILLRKRPEVGLLAGLWEVPTTPWQNGPLPDEVNEIQDYPSQGPILTDERPKRLTDSFEHIFSHRALRLVVWQLNTPNDKTDIEKALAKLWPENGASTSYRWWSKDTGQDIPLPTLTKKIIRLSSVMQPFAT